MDPLPTPPMSLSGQLHVPLVPSLFSSISLYKNFSLSSSVQRSHPLRRLKQLASTMSLIENKANAFSTTSQHRRALSSCLAFSACIRFHSHLGKPPRYVYGPLPIRMLRHGSSTLAFAENGASQVRRSLRKGPTIELEEERLEHSNMC